MMSAAGFRWIACELHTHTVHSDGDHTVTELAERAKRLGFDWIALTDHNTVSGLLERDTAERRSGLRIARGMEWTTFYGHMLTLGYDAGDYVDWRVMGPEDIHRGIEQVHRLGGIVGVAHPFRIGNPVCTGCYWEFLVNRWSDVDYVEVWNGPFPSVRRENVRAFRFWTRLLNEGCRIPAISGRDWHRTAPDDGPVSVTYIGLEDNGEETTEGRLLQAIREGRAAVTTGPLLTLQVTTESGQRFRIGDTVRVGASGSVSGSASTIVTVRLEVRCDVRSGHWALSHPSMNLRVAGSDGFCAEEILEQSGNYICADFELDASRLSWLRAELYGEMNGVSTLLAFTNCIYFETSGTTFSELTYKLPSYNFFMN
ncbi:CehA/McbA family metallohydrolase [Paenibacillus alkalitolerans]|uniref:CehA/McbA family metallohydrolase n=1 Tax=Paenibacillus alkalitolerans TaxID=2799335 RepID=UPI002D7F679B|nr:CehA/McbA family metallohydrolase [Paenibacillus alkalitolerans]